MKGELNHRDDFEAILQETMAEETVQAEAHVWDNIEAAITEENKRRGVIWWTWGLAAGIALLAGLFLVQNELSSGGVVVERIGTIEHGTTSSDDKSITNSSPEESPAHETNEENPLPDSQSTASHGSGNNSSSKKEAKQDWSGSVKVRATEKPAPMDYLKGLSITALSDEAPITMTRSDVVLEEILDDPTSQPKAWNLGGNVQSGNKSSSQLETVMAADPERGQVHGNSIASVSEASFAVDHKTHHVPMTIGFMVGRQLSKRLSLNTGLNYTRLVSTWGQADVAHKLQSHYVGVPAILNWEFLQSKKFKMYSSTGLLFEHGIASIQSTTMEINGAKSIQKYREPTPGFQGGIIAGFGMEYIVAKRVGLYLQPAVTTWVVNVNQPASIRTSQTLAPTLQLGARFQIK